jgi:hypothetical protein
LVTQRDAPEYIMELPEAEHGLPHACAMRRGKGANLATPNASSILKREIREETGLSPVGLGPVVWYGEDSHRSGDWKITFKEHFILAFAPTETIIDRDCSGEVRRHNGHDGGSRSALRTWKPVIRASSRRRR